MCIRDSDISSGWNSGLSVSSNWFNRHEFAEMKNNITSSGSQTASTNEMASNYRNVIANVFIKHNFAAQNGMLNLNFDYFNYHTNDIQNMNSGVSSNVYGDMGGTSTGYVVNLDFMRKALGNWDLSAGAKTSQILINNDGRYSGLLPDDISATDKLNSSFRYHENVNAVYAEGTFSANRFKASVGIRCLLYTSDAADD